MKYVGIGVLVAALLALNFVVAQTNPPTAPTSQGCFEVYDMVGETPILLNKCTGASWWYDNGFESDYSYSGNSGGQVRDRAWRVIKRQ
jgi:hypothetical protein